MPYNPIERKEKSQHLFNDSLTDAAAKLIDRKQFLLKRSRTEEYFFPFLFFFLWKVGVGPQRTRIHSDALNVTS